MRNDNSAPGEASTSGKDAIRQLLHTSPFVDQLSIRLTDLQPGVAKLTLPFAASFATLETNVPVGAIACLIDTAAMAAAWSGAKRAEKQRGTTLGLTIKYLAAANGEDLQATARVLRHAQSLVYLDVEVRSPSGSLVAQGLVAYKLS